MPSPARERSWLRPWAIVSAAWLGPAFLAALQGFLQSRLAHQPVAWSEILWQGGDWLLYAAFTPLVFRLAAQFPLRRGGLGRSLPLHLAAATALCAAWSLCGVLLRTLLIHDPQDWLSSSPLAWFLTTLPFGFAVYFAVVAAEHAFRYLLESRQRETQAARLATQLAEARLAALRMQLNPHFLFNSLNTLLVLVRDEETRKAADSIERLAGVLRRLLKADHGHEIPLGEEIDFLQQYLAIEEGRFSDRLRPRFEIDPDLLGAAVPELILQPLVENALRHGIGRRTDSGTLVVSARRDRGDLVLRVADDGAGLADEGIEEGVGLSNTRERLATLYGEGAHLDLTPLPTGGAVATLRLPFHPARGTGWPW